MELIYVTYLPFYVSSLLTENHTYDASGSSSLQSDPAATAAPVHPFSDLSVTEEVPFSVIHSDGGSLSEGEGLSGQPAFSSVLTVMAETVKHPVSVDQSRTLPTISRDETYTTQWPSHNSSHGSEMSSSASSAGDRVHPASSGLTFNLSPLWAFVLPPTVSAITCVIYRWKH